MNNIREMSSYIIKQVKDGNMEEDMAYSLLTTINKKDSDADEAIAIIGTAVRLPGADSVNEFWSNLTSGVNSIGDISEARFEGSLPYITAIDNMDSIGNDEKTTIENVVKAGYMNDIESFDAAFFNISNQEAKCIEPMQRLVLEIANETLEDAGYGGTKVHGSRTGVYIGADLTYRLNLGMFNPDEILSTVGSWTSIIGSRISYTYDFRGPCIVIDTACSSGLVAIHEACKAIRKDECTMALVGGINVFGKPVLSNESGLSEVENNNGVLIAFDKNSKGTVWGEGVGMVLLKPLKKAIEDKDNIYSVIKGSAINNDGTSNGVTSPNAEAQTDVIIKAWKQAKIDPEKITYIETHGTGTVVGDPIEVKGIEDAFQSCTEKKQFCGIGTVKTNIGHTIGASGIASLIKVALCLKNKKLTATLNFKEPNTYINFSKSPLYLVDKCTNWENNSDSIRLAGINSFGFNGTNCHIVIEEAPNVNITVEVKNKPYIFTLSAKNNNVLESYVNNYVSYLNETKELLQDISYTASTGRGHYNFRISIIAINNEMLKEKLLLIKKNGFISIPEEKIFYSKAKTSNTKNDELVEKIKAYSTDNFMQEEYLENCKELCNKYIAGEKIDFEKLYEGEPVKKVRIPVYPLERKKVKFAEHIMKDAEKAKKCPKKSELHPLINECLVKTYQENIYLTRFNINKQWVIQEHKINMSYVLPGTAYLEMARVVGSRFLNQDEIELRDFKFLSALIVEEDEDVEVQTIVKKEDDHLSILIVSREGDSEDYVDEEWSVHVEGKIYPAKDEAKKMNIDALKKKFARNEQHTRLSDISLDFYNLGPRWDNLYATSVDGEESLITLELPEEFSKDTDIFKVHPSMIDNAMNGLMGYIIKESGGHLYIPLEYESIKLYKPLPKKLYSYMHNFKNFKKDSEKITYDVIIMDEDGQVVAEAVNYNIKKVKSATAMLNRKKKKNSVYYYLGWIKESIKNNNKLNEKHDVVLIKDENGIGNELRENFEKQGFNVYEAEIGKEFVQEDSNRFKIENTKESYLKLLRTIGTDKEIKIVHLASIIGSSSCSELEESEKRIEKGVMSIFRLSQAFMELNINGETILISNSATAVTEKEEYIHAEGNALFGLGKTIREEYQKMKIRCIDIDEKTSSETLLNEILNNENLYQVAYRDDRYVQELRTMDIRRVKDNEVEMKSEGIYVLTGGLGGIGTEIAKYLASKNKVNIALINRTELPNREKWNDILLDNEDKRLCTKINRVLDIEMLGANVEVIKGDIKNYNDIDLIIKNLKEKYGKINGIVHAAGIAGEGLLDMKSEESFRDVIDPKIRGTKVIDTLTRHENLDFFIMFSSIATLSGGLGIGDYTAANSFLDAYLFNSRKTGVMKTINWPFWSETGMAVDGDFLGNSDGSAFHEISNAEAIDAFESFISKDINFSYVGKLNYKGILFRDYDNLPFKVSLNISSRLQSSKENTHVTLVGRNGDFTETEHVIAIMWGAIFGIDEIEVDDNFYELGGNSLISIKLENEIEKKFNILINENNMIETYDTIEKLASYVDSKGGKVSA